MRRPVRLAWALALIAAGMALRAPLRRMSYVAGSADEKHPVLGKVSYQIRRLMADLLWARLDSYLHEGPMVAGGGVAISSNPDLLAMLDWITVLDPHFVEAQSLLGQYYLGGGRWDRARELWERGIRLNPDNPRTAEIHGQLAVHMLRDLQDLGGAIGHFLRARELVQTTGYRPRLRDTFHVDIINGILVLTYLKTGQVEEARAIVRSGTHNLGDQHPAVRALLAPDDRAVPGATAGDGPKTPGREAGAADHDHQDQDQDHDHDHDQHDHRPEEPGIAPSPAAAPAAAGNDRRPRDHRERRWLEPWRIERMKRVTAAILALALAIGLGRRFTGRTLLVGLIILVGTVAPVAATPGNEVGPNLLSSRMTYFLGFTVVVAILIILVLNHLLMKHRLPRLASLDRLLEHLEEGLGRRPADATVLEVTRVCLDNGLHDRALSYLDRLTPEATASPQGQFYRILALLGCGRHGEALALYADLPPATLDRKEERYLRQAFREHTAFSRMKNMLLAIFLTDITISDLGGSGRHEPSLEELGRGLGPDHVHLAVGLPERYRNLLHLGTREGEHVVSAFDRDLDRRVRLRILQTRELTEDGIAAFISRAQLQGQVELPAVARVYDIHKDRVPCYAVEEIDGITLADWAGSGDGSLMQRSAVLLRTWEIGRSLATTGRAGGPIPFPTLDDLVQDAAGDLRVQSLRARVGSGESLLLELMRDVHRSLHASDAIDESASGEISYLRLSHGRLRRALDAEGDPVEVLRQLEAPLQEISRYLHLSTRERQAEDLMKNLRWIEGLHRSRIHALKSKFAIWERYRDEPDKLLRVFFRESNTSEVLKLLRALDVQRRDVDNLPPVGEVRPVTQTIKDLPIAEMLDLIRAAPEGGAGSLSDADRQALLASLEAHSTRFRELSRSMALLIEAYEVDLFRLVETGVSRSFHAARIEMRTEGPTTRLRVSRPEEFRQEFAMALDNLVTNAFEAGATRLEIVITYPGAQPFITIQLLDDGEGVPPELVRRVRQERFSSKAGGTSTGLSHAMEFLERCSGHLDLGRREGTGGTIVTMHLPSHER